MKSRTGVGVRRPATKSSVNRASSPRPLFTFQVTMDSATLRPVVRALKLGCLAAQAARRTTAPKTAALLTLFNLQTRDTGWFAGPAAAHRAWRIRRRVPGRAELSTLHRLSA